MGKILDHKHLNDLRSSGLIDETIDALGFYSGTDVEVQAILGFPAGPGLVIPYPCMSQEEPFSRVKPDQPFVVDGRPAKYLSPKASAVRAYIPPKTRKAIKDAKNAVIITEGEKKAAKADQEGYSCIGLGGVWGFLQNHHIIPDLEQIPWAGRPVIIAFDSDVALKSDVKHAIFILERELMLHGADVIVIRFNSKPDALKVGLDDFLVEESSEALSQLMDHGKSALAWEIDDIAQIVISNRMHATKQLFNKLARLEPMELEPYRGLCQNLLGIPRRDFQAQLRKAQENLEDKVDDSSVNEPKLAASIDARIEEKTRKLLMDPALLYLMVQDVHSLGVAGEDENICVLYLAITSRIIMEPLSLTLKGESATGKSFLVGKICRLFPESAYVAMTGMSRQALVYSQESYAHRTIIIFERPGMEASDYNIRTLQSEGRIVFETVVKNPASNEFYTQRVVKEGPTNFIFTTTAPELHAENDTRHWSLLMDESPRLTSAAKLETAKRYEGQVGLSEERLSVWRYLQDQLKPLNVQIPYARWLAEHTPDQPLRMRRDFNKLLALIEIVALLHQCQRHIQGDILIAGLEDYFMARELINQVFDASLTGINRKIEALVSEVGRLYQEKNDAGEQQPGVKPAEISHAMHSSASSVSRWLRPAIEAGLVEVLNETTKGRIKLVKPGEVKKGAPYFLPSVEELAEAFPDLVQNFHAVHPVTSMEVTLEDTFAEIENFPGQVSCDYETPEVSGNEPNEKNVVSG